MYKLKKSDPRFFSAYDGFHLLLQIVESRSAYELASGLDSTEMYVEDSQNRIYIAFGMDSLSNIYTVRSILQMVRDVFSSFGMLLHIGEHILFGDLPEILERLSEIGRMAPEEFQRLSSFVALGG